MKTPALLLALAACATAPVKAPISAATTTATVRSIAGDLDQQLRFLAGWPLSVRCQAVRDAVTRCEAAGLAPDCAFDGWNDRDHDHFTIAACLQRRETP